MSDSRFDIIVVGNGIAGLTAAKNAARSGLAVACIEPMMFGGLVININELDPSPTGEHGSGTEMASTLMMEISDLGVENISETASAIAREGNLIAVTTDGGKHHARALIVASGAKLKRLGIPGETEFEGRGVSQCADCDGPMYQNETAVVVGGGDSALQEALVLVQYCKSVQLVHHGEKFTGATHLKRGRFDLANGGTIFLDEIADMSLKTQAKVLRILQEQKFERVGGQQTHEVDVRVVAATNKDLRAAIQRGAFREDLY